MFLKIVSCVYIKLYDALIAESVARLFSDMLDTFTSATQARIKVATQANISITEIM